jgi:hypothetical protein
MENIQEHSIGLYFFIDINLGKYIIEHIKSSFSLYNLMIQETIPIFQGFSVCGNGRFASMPGNGRRVV